MFQQNRLSSISLNKIKIQDSFWSGYMKMVREKVLPYQWEILNNRVEGAEPSNCISNFEIAAGLKKGDFAGMVFQDTDVAKWLEAAAYGLATEPDEALEKIADEVIDLIEKAQQPDGYINTYFTVKDPQGRWKNLQEGHELYTAGHLIEAAVAYYGATGKDKFLKMMCRFCDYIYSVFGTDEGKIKGYPGHQEIELALVKLYRVTDNRRYLELAKYFIDQRGQEPLYFKEERKRLGERYIFPEFRNFDEKYAQYHQPPREQKTAVGHAVRAVYMYSAMADLAYEYGDGQLMEACRSIYDNIVNRKMYITGSIGASEFGESFAGDYDLPNDYNYSETCATIGLALFCNRMMQITGEAKYADTVETALYNTLLSGISLNGTEFFYVNPLDVWPDSCRNNSSKRHVKTERQKWFGVACCPPNIARTILSLGQYIYSMDEEHLYVNQFISGEAEYCAGGHKAIISQSTGYPFKDAVEIQINCQKQDEFTVCIRIPGWSRRNKAMLDGKEIDIDKNTENGYLKIKHRWHSNKIWVQFDLQPVLIAANPKVRADIGRVAIKRGPVVYCLEQADNGENLHGIQVPLDSELEESADEHLLKGLTIPVISIEAQRIIDNWGERLYAPAGFKTGAAKIKAIPYFLWGNRSEGEMLVWIRTV